jgi:acyl carrier protein
MMTEQELFTSVSNVVRSTLRLDANQQILPSTRVIGDLGAESIDMLDMACELEKVASCELDFHKMLQEHRANNKPDDFTVQEIMEAIIAQTGECAIVSAVGAD